MPDLNVAGAAGGADVEFSRSHVPYCFGSFRATFSRNTSSGRLSRT
jgi:hypothetical protein